jgi:hypothetical protein
LPAIHWTFLSNIGLRDVIACAIKDDRYSLFTGNAPKKLYLPLHTLNQKDFIASASLSNGVSLKSF